jgi:hypothetical protein
VQFSTNLNVIPILERSLEKPFLGIRWGSLLKLTQ